MTKIAVLVFVVVIVGLVLDQIQRLNRRNSSGRSLADKFARKHEPPLLGMEATDAAGVAPILQTNDRLAHLTGASGNRGSHIAAGATIPVPFPDDETYAARYIGAHDERK